MVGTGPDDGYPGLSLQLVDYTGSYQCGWPGVGMQEARMVAVMTDTERRCGTCKFWVPEKEGLVERARAKNPWPHCSITGDTKTEEDKPCLVWISKK